MSDGLAQKVLPITLRAALLIKVDGAIRGEIRLALSTKTSTTELPSLFLHICPRFISSLTLNQAFGAQFNQTLRDRRPGFRLLPYPRKNKNPQEHVRLKFKNIYKNNYLKFAHNSSSFTNNYEES